MAGGGVLMSEARAALGELRRADRHPGGETQAGKGSLAWDHPQCVGAIGATGTLAANRLAHDADLVIGIGTRYADFTTASMTAFQNPGRALRQHQHRGVRRLQGLGHPRRRRRPRDPGRADRRLCTAIASSADYAAEIAGLKTGMGSRGRSPVPLNNPGQPGAERSDRRHLGSVRAARRAALGGGQPSGRPAQAVAHAHAQRLSHGVRLLLHGLRDSRRHGRKDGRSQRARCLSSWATART